MDRPTDCAKVAAWPCRSTARFLAAGTADWPAAWVFLAVMVVLSLVGKLWLVRHDPALLDAVRFRWSSVPAWVQAIGALILLLSVWIGFQTMRENSFAAPVVKIQKDRGQMVISTSGRTRG